MLSFWIPVEADNERFSDLAEHFFHQFHDLKATV